MTHRLIKRRVPCRRCKKRRPVFARVEGDPFCSRECSERHAGTWKKNEARRKLLAVTSRHHRVLSCEDDDFEVT